MRARSSPQNARKTKSAEKQAELSQAKKFVHGPNHENKADHHRIGEVEQARVASKSSKHKRHSQTATKSNSFADMTSPARSAASAAEDEGRGNNGVDATDSVAMGESVYQSLDPLDPRKVSLDIFELYCQEMIMTTFVGRRVFLIKKMRYMIDRLIGPLYNYGRLWNRTIIANMVVRVCGRHAYVLPDEIEQGDQSYIFADCLVDFTPDKWKKIMVQFQQLRESMLRNDASLIVLPTEVDDGSEHKGGDSDEEDRPEEDDWINEELECHADFTKGYEKMMEWMKFHTCLSHLQPHLETAIQKGSIEGAESVVIPHDNIVAFDSAIDEQFGDSEDNKYARILNNLLELNKKISRPTRYGGLHLKSFSEIKQIYRSNSRQFDLERFQHSFLQLIRRWTDLVLPVPELSKLHYGSTNTVDAARKPMATLSGKENVHAPGADIGMMPSSFAASTSGRQQQRKRQKLQDDRKPPPAASMKNQSPPAAIETVFDNEAHDDIESSSEDETDEKMGARDVLKRKTKALMKKVKDPLGDCVAIAQSARTRKKAAESENEEESSDDDSKAVKTPSFLKKKKSAYKLSFTDSSDSDDSEGAGVALGEVPARYKPARRVQAPKPIKVSHKSTGQQRIKFLEVEDGAIRNGVDRFGAGKWAEIQRYYSEELKGRTAVQVKDRWRTLTKGKK
ncbi:hypothetical protein ACHAXR_011387 [Thalassiosira sp. AJA248-18]